MTTQLTPFPRLMFLIGLTVVYLMFELGFNARLLDLVGGEATLEEIENIELYGRFLSGCAAALFVFGAFYTKIIKCNNTDPKADRARDWSLLKQVLIALIASFILLYFGKHHDWYNPWLLIPLLFIFFYAKVIRNYKLNVLLFAFIPICFFAIRGNWSSNWLLIPSSLLLAYCFDQKQHQQRNLLTLSVLAVFATVITVFFFLQIVVEQIVEGQNAEQRRLALQTVLIQQGLVKGEVELTALNSDSKIFSQAEGKAFLALFPFMAMTVDQLERKIESVKAQMIEDRVKDKLGTPKLVYTSQYMVAMAEIEKKWQHYHGGRAWFDLNAEAEKQAEPRWNEYSEKLQKNHSWTPQSIPPRYKPRVAASLNKDLPSFQRSWDPSSRAMFNLAIAQEIESQIRSPNGIEIQGERVKPGLSLEEFVTLKSSQNALREKLKLPIGVLVRSHYQNEKDFTANYYQPLVKNITKDELAKYQAPSTSFEYQAPYYEVGQQAIRKTIIPALALFFSLMGAISHFAKLVMLLSKPISERLALLLNTKCKIRKAHTIVPVLSFLVWGGVISSLWLVLIGQDNRITVSPLYSSLENQIISNNPGYLMQFKADALHVIAVGQARGYPLFEGVRQNLLFGLHFGYAKK